MDLVSFLSLSIIVRLLVANFLKGKI
uniref:Uncharacterized protein n=1 Tax=Anguilla anguilla TaxID=7936 RepID=A0A0E9WDZ2_ANGAN